MPSPELQFAIELCRFSRRKRRPTIMHLGELGELRARYAAIAGNYPFPADVSSEVVQAGDVSAEWIGSSGRSDERVILYLHGGCYTTGSVETHRDLITRLALAASMRVLGLNYRLAPAHPFPAAVEDAVAAYRWLLASGISPKLIALAGDSAGAGLALATAITVRDEGVPMPSAIACVSPWVDLAVTGESMRTKAAEDPIVSREMLLGRAKQYLDNRDPYTPLASPLYADLHGIPPLLIQVGSAEVLLDDATRLAKRTTAAGVATTLEVWPAMIHVWHTFAPILPEAREAISRLGGFIRTHLDR